MLQTSCIYGSHSWGKKSRSTFTVKAIYKVGINFIAYIREVLKSLHVVQWEGLKHTYSLVSWIILSHKKNGSSGTLNSKVPDIHVEWRRTSMKSQAEDMLEIDKGEGGLGLRACVILKGFIC